MTKILKWRLSKLPSVEDLRYLVEDKVITKEEAREVLFSQEDEVTREKKDLESEIKFLRELVQKLSNNRSQIIVETIREIEVPYKRYRWYNPYEVWTQTCETDMSQSLNISASSTGDETILCNSMTSANSDFNDIKTF